MKRKVILGAGLLTAALLGCTERRAPPGPVTSALLEVSRETARLTGTRAPRPADTLAHLDELAHRVRALHGQGRSTSEALNEVIFEALAFQRDLDRDALDAMRLPLVLKTRRGTCLGLGAVYLAVAERAGLSLSGVLVPGHFFVRDGERNVELLRRGESLSDGWYRERYGVPAEAGDYLRPLTAPEVRAVFRYNVANGLRKRGHLQEAAALYREIARALPGFAEAQANLGLTLHALGDPKGARAAYEAARAAHPSLPGLDENLAALGESGP